ncbi:hypothetical protein [Nocardia sp. NPDC002869]|uniref:hypothetical protein n=1 Tax=Nocardia sp. NPDC002869 TaxID=3161032 RepID=UPI00398D0AF2
MAVELRGLCCLLFHREISTKLREGATAKEIEEYLMSHQDDGIFGIAAFDSHKAFHADSDNGVGNPILESDDESEIDTAVETQ